MLELFSEGGECLRSDARVVPHISEPPLPPQDVLPRQKCSFSLKNRTEFQTNSGQILVCLTIDSVFTKLIRPTG